VPLLSTVLQGQSSCAHSGLNMLTSCTRKLHLNTKRPPHTTTHYHTPHITPHHTTTHPHTSNNDTNDRNDEYVAPSKAKAISKLVQDLCSELRSVALPLVAAWGVPDHILRAPIGLGSHTGVDIYREYLSAVGFDV